MNPAQLLSHFDRISEAPDAIPLLRRFILDLAVRGKLAEQDPKDEPGLELLRRIQGERERHSADSISRKNKADSQVDIAPIPFELPKSWVSSSLGSVARYGLSEKVDSNKEISANTWVLDLEDIEKDSSRLVERILSSSRPFRSSKTRFKKGDVLFGKLRPYLNKVLVADADGVCTTEIVPVRGFRGMVPEYIRLVLKSPLTMQRVDRLMYGMKMPRLGTEDALALTFPLPPIAEQHRIVAKVDELMALCDRLEAAQTERESRRDSLAAASLHRLNNGADADAFPNHARFYFNHLPRLTTRTEHIQQLRQTILNLAVRGKLVPQDINDESAAKMLGKHELFPDVKSEPWALPSGWAWSSLGLIGETLGGGTPSKADSKFWHGAIPWVSPKDMKVDVIKDAQDHISESAVANSSARPIPPGSLLMVVRGMILAHSFPTAISAVPLTINQDMKAIVPFRPDLIPMLLLLTKGLKPEVLRLVLRSTHGTCKLLTADLFSLPIPIPPLAEQQRIVAKVDELMVLCDQLEARLTTTQTESRRLLEAVLHEALSGRKEHELVNR